MGSLSGDTAAYRSSDGVTWNAGQSGSVHIDKKDEAVKPWGDAGIIICRNDIPDILGKLTDVSISAPFRVVKQTRHFRIFTWAVEDLENIRNVTYLVKRFDP